MVEESSMFGEGEKLNFKVVVEEVLFDFKVFWSWDGF